MCWMADPHISGCRSLKGGDGNLKVQPTTLGKREGQAFTCHVEGTLWNMSQHIGISVGTLAYIALSGVRNNWAHDAF
jgi:hypothetical protein